MSCCRARGINFRSNQVAGFFSQIGQLYMVHHVWHYKDLQSRKDVREDSWTKPGWDEIVAYTGTSSSRLFFSTRRPLMTACDLSHSFSLPLLLLR